jgi:hypothetical protein
MLEIKVSGVKLKLDPWDGDIFTAKLMPRGRSSAEVKIKAMAEWVRAVPD